MKTNDMLSKEEMFKEAAIQGYSIGAFNVFNMVTAEAVVQASNELQIPAIIQMSMTVLKRLGIAKATAMLNAAVAESDYGVYYHLDHCTEPETAKKCIQAGWQSIMFDGSSLSFDENVSITKELVEYGASYGTIVEGEIGLIQGVEDHISVDNEELATSEEVERFADITKVFAIAPSIGTAHGVYKGTPKINYDLIVDLNEKMINPIVIHGGTGLELADYQKLVKSGAAKINVSTALKQAYISTMKQIDSDHTSANPMDYDDILRDSVREVIKKSMKSFILMDKKEAV